MELVRRLLAAMLISLLSVFAVGCGDDDGGDDDGDAIEQEDGGEDDDGDDD